MWPKNALSHRHILTTTPALRFASAGMTRSLGQAYRPLFALVQARVRERWVFESSIVGTV